MFSHRLRPRVTISKAHVNSSRRSATFDFNAMGAVRFQCKLIRPAKKPTPVFGPCRSPTTYKHLKRGKYTFLVRGVSSSGSTRPPARKTFGST